MIFCTALRGFCCQVLYRTISTCSCDHLHWPTNSTNSAPTNTNCNRKLMCRCTQDPVEFHPGRRVQNPCKRIAKVLNTKRPYACPQSCQTLTPQHVARLASDFSTCHDSRHRADDFRSDNIQIIVRMAKIRSDKSFSSFGVSPFI